MTSERTAFSGFSGQRFIASYRLQAPDRQSASRLATDICIEQTVEFPADLIDDQTIRSQVFGHVESLEEPAPGRWSAQISFAVELCASDFPQLLNVLFGNISLHRGIRLEWLHLPDGLLASFRGPRFGVQGLRQRLGLAHRPLLCTALKPMGLSADQLADLAYRLALGGIDLIKDDHGLADQPFATARERIALCAAAVARASRESGHQCLYVPNLTAPAHVILERARLAKELGAGGMLLAPGLIGFDTMRCLAEDDELALPILAHPALLGGNVCSDTHGIGHRVSFGTLMRLAGADAVIFPNHGGRFPFTPAACREIQEGCSQSLGHLVPILPVPAGGMDLTRIGEMLRFYGNDVIFLIGGDLHRHGKDVTEGCRKFVEAVREPVCA